MRIRRLPVVVATAAALLASGIPSGLALPAAGAASAPAGARSLAAGARSPAAAAEPVAVTVNARAGLARMADTGLGVNHAIWDSQLGTNAVMDLLKTAGVRMMRYPGGSYSDIYHWKDHTAPGGYVAPNTDFDTFMAAVRRADAEPMIVANYGTGTAEEAADWVRYANVTKSYGTKYWTIGNENYGNGHYGANWEADNHDDKSPTAYANGVVAFADAMKAVDPAIKVGAVLTMPANWPDAIVASGDSASWNKTVLSIAGPKIDFVDVHWYPGGSTPAESLTKTEQIDDAVYMMRDLLTKHAGANADRIGISLTETNVSVGMNTQPGALYLADAYSSLLANGVFTVNWWNVHNGPTAASTIAGQPDYADWGMLSSGTCLADGVTCEPALNTPFASYYALSMMNTFARPGDQFIKAGTNQSLVTAHAARRSNGDLAVLLLNKDPDNSRPVTIDYAGYTPAATTPTVYSYVNGGTSVTSTQTGTATTQTLPPYSLTTLILHPETPTSGAPAAPSQPTASAVTDRTATISWPATSPATKYEIWRQNGAIGEQLGETNRTSFNVANLNPGTRYTVNVLARDTAGKVSWSSPPLTFTTGSPANSTCKVHFAANSDWGNGYIAGVDVTNTAPAPITGWTLTYTWPTKWQQMNSGWNATWTQTGQVVKATNPDSSPTLPANGGTTSIGFVAAYSGPNILPSIFTLNGQECQTV